MSTKLLTVDEVAETFDVNPRTIYNWTAEGLLPAIRIGRLMRFHPEDVEAVIESRRASIQRHPAFRGEAS